MENYIFFTKIALLLISSPVVSQITRLPVVVVEILLGSLAVWSGFLELGNDIFEQIAKIGFFYLMFLAGLEIDLKNYTQQKNDILNKAIIYFTTLYALSFILYLLFDLNPVYIVAIPIVSLGMIMVLINEHGKEHKWLEVVLTVGVIGEILSISAIVIFESYVNYGLKLELYLHVLVFFGVLFAIYYLFKLVNLIFWWYPNLKKAIMPYDDSKVQSIRISVALFIVLTSIMHFFNIDMVLGAFFAGIFISNFFEHKTDLPHTLHKIGFGFLVPLFFIYVGTTLDFTLIFSFEILNNALLILLALVLVRTISSFAAYTSLLGAKGTFLLALGDSMPLTFLIAIATIAYEGGQISQNEYLSFIVAGMLSGILIMSLLKFIIYMSYQKRGQ
ncbi:cation:proton antiporter [Sulfurimonas sp.]|uniref:cation:proton antiporter n=1 Tax=Sulfurimonas sp. TaxID=2022749 RepID=UPI0025F69D56|nr:cation:proton antiporter [Sulfurimonas sp.]MBW6489432.1 cation:proton antiporter [Sulfurimonas sp.]